MTGLADRVAVVTGASMGIGAGLAAMLAAEGAKVVLAARRETELERVAAGIRQRGGVAVPVVTDLADDDSLARLVATAHAEAGPVDVLVNNAGYALDPSPADGPPSAQSWRREHRHQLAAHDARPRTDKYSSALRAMDKRASREGLRHIGGSVRFRSGRRPLST
jgi:short-subunit dehydrogenase